MSKNDNEIKFIKSRSNDFEVLADLFKKGRYYDAFYQLKRLDKSEQVKFHPLVAEAYAKLKKPDYEANALLKFLINSDEVLSGNGLDKQVVALRLSEYYNYKGEKLQRLSVSFNNNSQAKARAGRQRLKTEAQDIIKFPVKERKSELGSNNIDNECKIYKKASTSTDYGTYICGRATMLALAGKYSDAEKVLKRIKKDSPYYLESRSILIAVYIDSNNLLDASEVAIELIKENPDEFMALFAISTALNFSINKDKILQTLIEIEGVTGAQCSILRANALSSCGEYKKAIEILESLEGSERYLIDVLKVKALCHAGLGDKENEVEVLKQLVTIYSKDIKSRYILSKFELSKSDKFQELDLEKMHEYLTDDFKDFYDNKLPKLNDLKISSEELEYYYELCLNFGSVGVVAFCTDKYLKCEKGVDIVCDALVDMTLDDIKKMTIVERMILSKSQGEYYTLINGVIKKSDLARFENLTSQFKETLTDTFIDLKDEYEPLNNLIDTAFAKAFALSIMYELDCEEVANKVEALILYALLHSSDDKMIELVNILNSAKNLACGTCVLVNPQLAKNSKLKKYLGLKNAEIDEIIDILRQAGLRK